MKLSATHITLVTRKNILTNNHESGFCLTPYLPYGWQEKGETITVKSGRSRRINVLEILNRKKDVLSKVGTDYVINFA
jgi:hypothetical protein